MVLNRSAIPLGNKFVCKNISQKSLSKDFEKKKDNDFFVKLKKEMPGKS